VKMRKGDMVMVMVGRDRGKTGKVLRIDREKGRVWIERLGMVKRHQKPSQQHRQGGIVEKESPFQISNIMVYDEKAAKPTRVGIRLEGGRKVRYSKRSGEVLTAAAK
jgi:large subunit ribosomal protein L24